MRLPKPDSEQTPEFRAVDDALDPARKYAQSHGGDIRLLEVTSEGDVVVKLRGACAMCPLSTITLKIEVEKRLREQLPFVRRILTK